MAIGYIRRFFYCSNLDSASPSRPPIESQAIYHSLESEQQQDHVDVGKRVNMRTIGAEGINSPSEGSRVGFLRPNGEDTLESLALGCTTLRYACNPSPRILYPLHNVHEWFWFSWDFPLLQRARR